jgi:hypothetical protein
VIVLGYLIFIVPDDPEVEMEEETRALLTSDFEIGHYIRERIVPRAILYFTGKTVLWPWCFLTLGCFYRICTLWLFIGEDHEC